MKISEYVLHRWEYDFNLRCHVCVPPFLTASPDRCHGCGKRITDEELYHASDGEELGVIKSAMLNTLAMLGRTDANRDE